MKIENFGIYNVDKEYVRKLYEKDNEVFFEDKKYDSKPYVGIVVTAGKYNYLIPLTSAKKKHVNWKLISKDTYIIYEIMPEEKTRPYWTYCKNGDGTVKHFLSVLEIKKMIPVPDELFKRIIFPELEDKGYAMLLNKEYHFLKPYINDILEKASSIYEAQKSTGKINRFTCNFSLLEEICDTYANEQKGKNAEAVTV